VTTQLQLINIAYTIKKIVTLPEGWGKGNR